MTDDVKSTDDAPLDPAAERLRSKLVRFMIINLIVVFGLVAIVVGVLIYRSVSAPTDTFERAAVVPSGESTLAKNDLQLRAGEQIEALSADGSRVTIHVKGADGDRIIQIDMRDGRVLSEIAIERAR